MFDVCFYVPLLFISRPEPSPHPVHAAVLARAAPAPGHADQPGGPARPAAALGGGRAGQEDVPVLPAAALLARTLQTHPGHAQGRRETSMCF